MKSAVLALVLSSFPLLAQPAVGPEMLSDPMASFTPAAVAAPRVALARDRDGVAMAWMVKTDGGVRIAVARLDKFGRIVGTPSTLPLASSSLRNAEFPSLAALPGGSGFLLAWIELASDASAWRGGYCRLDAALHATAPAGLYPILTGAILPVLARSGVSTAWVSSGGWVTQLAPAEAVPVQMNGNLKATDMTIVNDLPQLAGGESETVVYCYTIFGQCHDPNPRFEYDTRIDYASIVDGIPRTRMFKYVTDARPAVASHGADVFMVWMDGAQSSGGDVLGVHMPPVTWDFPSLTPTPQRLGSFARDDGATRPDIATDGSRYFVVWRTASADGSHDVMGAVVEGDGSVTPLPIASTSADERDPSVVAIDSGVFLVAYEWERAGERRIATRIVTLASHRRAAGR